MVTQNDQMSKKLITFKDCPRCSGSGKVPCDGKEWFHQENKRWALSFHLQPVAFQHYSGNVLIGLAAAKLLQGGWYCIKVYIGVTPIPKRYVDAGKDGYMVYELDGRGIPRSPFAIQGVGVSDFDIIEGKAFWYEVCRVDSRGKLKLLDYWPEVPCLEDRKLLAAHIVE